MTGPVAPTFSQIKAQVAAIRKTDERAQVFGIRSQGRWEGEGRSTDGEEVYRIIQCDSPLQIRMALQELADDVAATVIVTNLPDEQIGQDIRVRLARRKLYPIKAWQIVKTLFQAKHVDPRLTKHSWIADALMEMAPPAGYPPVPSGVLDAETAWDLLLTRRLGMPAGGPDLVALLKWSMAADNVQRWRDAREELRTAAQDWISQYAGPAGTAVLRCAAVNDSPDALPIGLALDVIFNDEAQGQLDRAAGRMEGLTGTPELTEALGRRWALAAVEVARYGFADSQERQVWLKRSDEILAKVGAASHAFLSEVSPLGFEQRLGQFGEALDEAVARGAGDVPSDVLDAVARISAHDMARDQRRQIDRVEMAVRLLRWLAKAGGKDAHRSASFGKAAERYAAEGGWVDWARTVLCEGEPLEGLAKAYSRLLAVVSTIREQDNHHFAQLLRDWTRAGSRGTAVLPVERVLEAVVAPLAGSTPVLLLLMDGMSCAVFLELLGDITSQNWVELCPRQSKAVPPVISTIPSVTQAARASLLCGALREGTSRDESAGFAENPALLAACRGGEPPVVFHKVAVGQGPDGSLADAVRRAIQSTKRRVVGVVVNSVDDLLFKGDQFSPQWNLERVPILGALMYEASEAGRAVVLASDHGHVLERETKLVSQGEGDRWREDDAPAAEGEMVLSGDRVLGSRGNEAVAAWSERIRYGGKKRGYHGGATPQEMIAPLAVLTARGEPPDGWSMAPVREPDWWRWAEPPEPPADQVEPAERPAGQVETAEKLPLLEMAGQVEPAAPEWVEELLKSDVFGRQREIAGRTAPKEAMIRKFLMALHGRGNKLGRTALAKKLELPPVRVGGVISGMRRVLNVEGYVVLNVDDATDSVELNMTLLRSQFDLRREGTDA